MECVDCVVCYGVQAHKHDTEKISEINDFEKNCRKNNIFCCGLFPNFLGIKKYYFCYSMYELNRTEKLDFMKNSNLNLKISDKLCQKATEHGHLDVLMWIKNNYRLNILGVEFNNNNIEIIKFWVENYDIKKIIKIFKPSIYMIKSWKFYKTIRLKTKKRYFKGYEKN